MCLSILSFFDNLPLCGNIDIHNRRSWQVIGEKFYGKNNIWYLRNIQQIFSFYVWIVKKHNADNCSLLIRWKERLITKITHFPYGGVFDYESLNLNLLNKISFRFIQLIGDITSNRRRLKLMKSIELKNFAYTKVNWVQSGLIIETKCLFY